MSDCTHQIPPNQQNMQNMLTFCLESAIDSCTFNNYKDYPHINNLLPILSGLFCWEFFEYCILEGLKNANVNFASFSLEVIDMSMFVACSIDARADWHK